MAHSDLATISVPVKNYTPGREKPIRTICIHHMGGILSAQRCGEILNDRGVSAHYGIGNDGEIAWYVDEADTAWANGNWASNCESISIETSDAEIGGEWRVGEKAYQSLIKLVADIAKRNGMGILVKGDNLIWHSMVRATDCPGNFLRSKIEEIARKANEINSGSATAPATPAPSQKKSNEQIADEVIAGQWGNGEVRREKLASAGYDYNAIQAIVNQRFGVNSSPKVTTAGIQAGDQVTLRNWVDYNGTSLMRTRDSYTVSEVKGDRVVLTSDGVVYAAVKKSNLIEL